MKSTNYHNTFIEVSGDCPVSAAEIPQSKGENKTVAQMKFEMITRNPYVYTSDEVLFTVFALRNQILPSDTRERETFFAKGQACFRASPLCKRYGWGVHHNEEGKMALYALESEEYRFLKNNPDVKHTKAMRNKRN